jgi:hypothetical protein
VPRREANLARVGRPGERVVVESEAAHQRERGQTVGLPQDLGHERSGITASRGEQHLHAGAEATDGVGERDLREGATHEARVV